MTDVPAFSGFGISALPRIVFGRGKFETLATEIAAWGRTALLVTGGTSFAASGRAAALAAALRDQGLAFETCPVADEPSPDLVDAAVERHHGDKIEVVVGIGGGSALDAAKAIAGLLASGRSAMDYLEGVGRGLAYEGPALPLIAVPTTAGTGTEATKNAVLSRRGRDGFKKSFRDDRLIAKVAVIDPDLLASCPPAVIAANGMDAFTQLLKSLTSTRANPLTDALGWSGLAAFRDGFFPCLDGDPQGRERMAYAALVSGINLAQTGLGVVHGLASPLGAYFPAPHGMVCGTLVAEATAVNIAALRTRNPRSPALSAYARAGALLDRRRYETDREAGGALVERLRGWIEKLDLPRLSAYGMGEDDIAKVVAASGGNSMKTNPLMLKASEIETIVRRRL